MGTASKKPTKRLLRRRETCRNSKTFARSRGSISRRPWGKFTSSELREIETGKAVGHSRRREHLTRAKRTKEAEKPKQLLRKKCVQYFYGGLEETAFVKRKEEQREQLGDEAEEKTSPKRSSARKQKRIEELERKEEEDKKVQMELKRARAKKPSRFDQSAPSSAEAQTIPPPPPPPPALVSVPPGPLYNSNSNNK